MSVGLLPSTRTGPRADPARELFASDADFAAFVRIRDGRRGEPCAKVRVAALQGAEITLRPGTTDARTLMDACLERFHEPLHPLPHSAVILDLGANIGLTALDLAQRNPTARILAVEMDAANLQLARTNTATVADRVTLVHAAVWSNDGEIAYAPADEDSLSVCATTPPSTSAELRRVPARTVATLLRKANLTHIDFCKIDIEGAEAAVLASAPWLPQVHSIHIEVHPPAATVAGTLDALRAAGMTANTDRRHWSCVVASRTA